LFVHLSIIPIVIMHVVVIHFSLMYEFLNLYLYEQYNFWLIVYRTTTMVSFLKHWLLMNFNIFPMIPVYVIFTMQNETIWGRSWVNLFQNAKQIGGYKDWQNCYAISYVLVMLWSTDQVLVQDNCFTSILFWNFGV